jgi:multicomponent Na+:H+ antiporter subunit F
VETVHLVGGALVVLGVLVVLRRVLAGPTLLDRVVALNVVVGTKTILLIVFVGFVARRPGFFLDIALTYALINFVGTIAVLRWFEIRAGRPPEREGP